MLKRFVCLANSYKDGGRCLAGIELNSNNEPIVKFGFPVWIRPVCNSDNGEIPAYMVAHLNLLDIIEIYITGYPQETGYQTENAFFREDSIKAAGKFNPNNLIYLCDNRSPIFGNRGKAVSEEAIKALTYSLMFIKTNKFQVVEKIYDDSPDKPRVRLSFFYDRNEYDLPVTDAAFLRNYKVNPAILTGITNVYLTLSLALVHDHWHSKLVAGIILLS